MPQAPLCNTVLYDGECPICLRAVRQLKRLDSRRTLTFIPAQDPEVPQRFPFISPEALESSMHLVTPGGEVREGADALESILGLLPVLSWAEWMFRVPGARLLARKIYRWIARNRYQLTCGEHCSRPEDGSRTE